MTGAERNAKMKNWEINEKHIGRILVAMGRTGDEKVAFHFDRQNGITAEFTECETLIECEDFSWLEQETTVPDGFFSQAKNELTYDYTDGSGQTETRIFQWSPTEAVASTLTADHMIAAITTLRDFIGSWFNLEWEDFRELEAEATATNTDVDLQQIVGLMY